MVTYRSHVTSKYKLMVRLWCVRRGRLIVRGDWVTLELHNRYQSPAESPHKLMSGGRQLKGRRNNKKKVGRLKCETQPGLHSYRTKLDCPKIIRGLLLSFLSPSRDNTLLLPQKFLTTFHGVSVDTLIVSTDIIILCEAAWAVGVACKNSRFSLLLAAGNVSQNGCFRRLLLVG